MKNITRRSKTGFFLSLFVGLVVTCQVSHSQAGNSAPVVIWCPNDQFDVNPFETASNPLQKLSSEDFEKSLSKLGKIDLLIVANELCVEDLRNNKVLSNITNGSKLYYFPSVDTPYSAFWKTCTYKQEKTIQDVNDEHELNMALKDTNLTTCVALTGKECRYSYTDRIKRDVAADNSTEFKIKADNVLLYSSKPLYFKVSDKANYVQLPSSKAVASTHKYENGTLSLKITFSDIENIGSLILEFFFSIKSIGYYSWKRVHYENNNQGDDLETKQNIYFPFNFSYHCSQKTIFSSNSVYLNITDVQLQIDSRNGTFSDAYDCVGFTTIPIWSGIFVTGILALIMVWALTMIMDIRTMDRFDDPKGKTITISAVE